MTDRTAEEWAAIIDTAALQMPTPEGLSDLTRAAAFIRVQAGEIKVLDEITRQQAKRIAALEAEVASLQTRFDSLDNVCTEQRKRAERAEAEVDGD